MPSSSVGRPSLAQSFLPVVVLIGLLGANVALFGEDATYGPNQIALILAAAVCSIVAILRLNITWLQLQERMVKSIASAMTSMLILLIIGALAGTWLISGIVPAMIYYGLQILEPKVFLVAACVVCALVSVATGSSWTTIATVGIALLGIGQAIGLSQGLVGGAIISGAYFGDKMSPLSDTTNLAPAMAGTDLFTHIGYMAQTTVPSIIITLVIFTVWGFVDPPTTEAANVSQVLSAIESKFLITPWLFIVPVLLVALIALKSPALPTLLAGALMGAVAAVIAQPQVLYELYGSGDWSALFAVPLQSMFGDTSITTGYGMVDDLLSAGGMAGMLNTIWLIMMAMVFGGVMEQAGMLQRITAAIISLAHRTGSLVASTVGTCLFFNVTASDQYLAIVVPGRMYADTYRKRGLAPEVLSRTLEDSGTVTSVLVPWNTCGATQASVLGVPVLAFAPYCFFNIISPFMSITFAYLNIKIRRIETEESGGEGSR